MTETVFVSLGLSQDGACTDLAENLSENNLKGGLSNGATFNPPLFSLGNTFKPRSSEDAMGGGAPSAPFCAQLSGA
jgi:hypothetical protein